MKRLMRNRLAGKSRVALVLPALVVLVLTGCGRTTLGSAAQPRVTFLEPRDGQTVSSPVSIRMGVENFTVEPAGPVQRGRGHLHLMVDADCVPVGQAVPKDDAHIHYGKGQVEDNLQLAPGSHRLCLQAADGAHMALDGDGTRQTIAITVK